MDRTCPCTGPGGIREEPRDTRVHFLPPHACGELLGARREILGDEVEDLRAHMPAAASPAGSGVCRFDRIADILAIPFRDFAEDAAVRAHDLAGVALVGA